MRLPVNALSGHLAPLPSTDDIARTLTSIGFEVEGREDSVDGVVLEINVTPNRGDALSVRGLARELCAALERPFAELAPPALPPAKGNSSLPIQLPDPRCPRYLGVEIRGVKNGPSPAAVQKRLEAFGMRPISILVDAANWVMLELGQPLHTFDLDTLKGGITVRAARSGEKLVTLDGQTRDLTPWPVKGQSFAPLLICDGENGVRPVALAGVMGGGGTEISGPTKNIYLEAASFDPLAVRRTARKFTLLSEASHRFEREVDPALPAMAAARFVQLLNEWGAGGEIAGWRLIETVPQRPRTVELRDAALARLLGINVKRDFIETRLKALGLVCRECTPEKCRWEIPSWRADLAIEEDLIEEVGRHHGYDRIPERLPRGIDPGSGRTAASITLSSLREKAWKMGYSEIVSIPFVSAHDNGLVPGAGKFAGLPEQPEQPDHGARISNPIWLDRPELRSSLVSSLLPAVMGGLDSGSGRFDYQRVKVFETGNVFLRRPGLSSEGHEAHAEDGQFCLLRMFSRKEGNVESRTHELIRDLAALLGGKPEWVQLASYPDLLLQGSNPHFKLQLISSQKLFPREARHNFDLGLIQLRLQGYAGRTATFVPFSDAPAVIRDLNLLLPQSCEFLRLKHVVSEVSANGFESLAPLDSGFTGPGVPEGHRALAVRFTFRKPDGTLTTEEAEAGLEKIKAALAKIGVTVRGVS